MKIHVYDREGRKYAVMHTFESHNKDGLVVIIEPRIRIEDLESQLRIEA